MNRGKNASELFAGSRPLQPGVRAAIASVHRTGRSADSRRGVVDQKLHRVAAAPPVATQMTGDVDRGTTRLGEELA